MQTIDQGTFWLENGEFIRKGFVRDYYVFSIYISESLFRAFVYLRDNSLGVFSQFIASFLMLGGLCLAVLLFLNVISLAYLATIKVVKFCLYLFECLWNKRKLERLVVPAKPEFEPFGNTVFHSDDGKFYTSRGEIVSVTKVPSGYFDKGKEMSMDNSVFNSSGEKKTKTMGVVAIRNSADALIGMGSCIGYKNYGPCLLTATHVWREVMRSGSGKLEHNGQTFTIDTTWKPYVYSSVDELDVCIIGVPHSVFAAMSVKKLKVGKLNSRSQCTVYGYTSSGEFGYSMGSAMLAEQAFRLKHFASTIPGFSGSPVIWRDKVVGVHTCGNIPARYNEGTVLFWLEMSNTESEVTIDPNEVIFVDQLPKGDVRYQSYQADGYNHQIQQVGKSVKVIKTPRKFADVSWFEDETAMDFSVPFAFESVDFLKGKPAGPNQQPDKVSEPIVLFPQPTRPSSGSSISGTTGKKKRKKQKKGLVSSKSEPALIAPTVAQPSICRCLSEPVLPAKVLQSGTIRPETQRLNDEACSFRPQDIMVRVAVMSKRQEKLFNRICQHRKYQQVFRDLPMDERLRLRNLTLDFVLLSKSPLTETQVQDFLSGLSVQQTRNC
jgi:V8-like Glu-specific endopeptidase